MASVCTFQLRVHVVRLRVQLDRLGLHRGGGGGLRVRREPQRRRRRWRRRRKQESGRVDGVRGRRQVRCPLALRDARVALAPGFISGLNSDLQLPIRGGSSPKSLDLSTLEKMTK